MSSNKKFWDKIAPKYAKDPIKDMEAYTYTLERTRSYLGAGDRALELGCGTGSTALLLAPDAGHIDATDLADGMIDIGREKAAAQGIDNVTFAQRDVMDQSDSPAQYDVVMGFNLFHLVPERVQVFDRIAALTKTGGYFISKTPCLGARGARMIGFFVRFAVPLMALVGKAPKFVALFDIATLEAEITAAGFEIVETGNHPAGPPPARYIVARKV